MAVEVLFAWRTQVEDGVKGGFELVGDGVPVPVMGQVGDIAYGLFAIEVPGLEVERMGMSREERYL